MKGKVFTGALASTLAAALVVAVATPRAQLEHAPDTVAPIATVVAKLWLRQVRGRRKVVSRSDRPFWPDVSKDELKAWLEAEGADPRYWSPRNCEERYWVEASDGKTYSMPLLVWSNLDRGSPIPQGLTHDAKDEGR